MVLTHLKSTLPMVDLEPHLIHGSYKSTNPNSTSISSAVFLTRVTNAHKDTQTNSFHTACYLQASIAITHIYAFGACDVG